MAFDDLSALARAEKLAVFAALHTTKADDIGAGTLALLGPAEPGFWPHVTAAREFNDGAPDPMDRWSGRVISAIADDLGGRAVFPFGDPPQPFIGWALRGGCFASPVSLLVHATAGLFVSFRGAVFFSERLSLPPPAPNPCTTCIDKPCLTACPASALGEGGYDLPTCHDFLELPAGQNCMTEGCAVRRACPAGAGYRRVAEQSAYHMEQFHP